MSQSAAAAQPVDQNGTHERARPSSLSEAVRWALELFDDPDAANAAEVARGATALLGQTVTRDNVHVVRSWIRDRVKGGRITRANLLELNRKIAAGESPPILRKKGLTQPTKAHWCRLALLEMENPDRAGKARVAVLATSIARRHGQNVAINRGDVQSCVQTLKRKMGVLTHDKIRKFGEQVRLGKVAAQRVMDRAARSQPAENPRPAAPEPIQDTLDLIILAKKLVVKAGSASKAIALIQIMEAAFGNSEEA